RCSVQSRHHFCCASERDRRGSADREQGGSAAPGPPRHRRFKQCAHRASKHSAFGQQQCSHLVCRSKSVQNSAQRPV
ncbi:MAG: hypothetical protein ACK56I_27265, partial [bacterium]